MENTYLLSNPSCVGCREYSKNGELKLNEGKIYGKNIFNIPDSFVRNANSLNAKNFMGFLFLNLVGLFTNLIMKHLMYKKWLSLT